MKIKIDKISVKKRVRSDIGDLSKLKISMKTYGLINPLTVTEKNQLIAGYRRLESAKQLGWTEIDCHIVKPKTRLDKLMIEADENNLRKDFNFEEKALLERMKEYYSAGFFKRIIFLIIEFFSGLKNFFINLFNRIFKKG